MQAGGGVWKNEPLTAWTAKTIWDTDLLPSGGQVPLLVFAPNQTALLLDAISRTPLGWSLHCPMAAPSSGTFWREEAL